MRAWSGLCLTRTGQGRGARAGGGERIDVRRASRRRIEPFEQWGPDALGGRMQVGLGLEAGARRPGGRWWPAGMSAGLPGAGCAAHAGGRCACG